MKKEDGMKTPATQIAPNPHPHSHSIARHCNNLLCLGFLALLVAATAPAQVLTTLATFDGPHGGNPQLMTLAQGLDGNLYGTTKFWRHLRNQWWRADGEAQLYRRGARRQVSGRRAAFGH